MTLLRLPAPAGLGLELANLAPLILFLPRADSGSAEDKLLLCRVGLDPQVDSLPLLLPAGSGSAGVSLTFLLRLARLDLVSLTPLLARAGLGPLPKRSGPSLTRLLKLLARAGSGSPAVSLTPLFLLPARAGLGPRPKRSGPSLMRLLPLLVRVDSGRLAGGSGVRARQGSGIRLRRWVRRARGGRAIRLGRWMRQGRWVGREGGRPRGDLRRRGALERSGGAGQGLGTRLGGRG